jgi:hypothetical protein
MVFVDVFPTASGVLATMFDLRVPAQLIEITTLHVQ